MKKEGKTMKPLHKIFAAALSALMVMAAPLAAQDDDYGGYDNSTSYAGADAGVGINWMPQGGFSLKIPFLGTPEPNTTVENVMSANAKMIMMQGMMAGNPMSLRQSISIMVAKKRVADGLSLEDVVESMDLRANLLNMKKVGHSTPWKVIEATTGEPSPKLEMISYCDIPTMRDILNYVPEFSVFVPCRISVLEDAEGNLWIMTLDWDVRWMDTSPNPNKISPELREKALMVRENLESIMEAGANGDL
ncbi:DUF302 domain-containing protein [Alisedimentitalea sp. MJ-SS2]|uniref:DUF302 domain-containing protein n=1 Tax=Aliisedimentitalea sp. MJ-SS2 TaxID=3049795 RepID=UPI0029116CD6|nr:DUF302 domain-containing protein [Alisedimentitalea sp. MJ-SS2]MDU8930007.1 DUF302 domain-containing protein [Alisedimentitalea sp. MJ-SS2]